MRSPPRTTMTTVALLAITVLIAFPIGSSGFSSPTSRAIIGLRVSSRATTTRFVESVSSSTEATTTTVILREKDEDEKDAEAIVEVEAYVTGKRSLGKSLAFVDFVSTTSSSWSVPGRAFQGVLRRDDFSGDDHDARRACLSRGCRVRATGVVDDARRRDGDETSLSLRSATLVRAPPQPQHVRTILRSCADGALPLEEVARACATDVEELRRELFFGDDDDDDDDDLGALARRVVAALPDDPERPDDVDRAKGDGLGAPRAPRRWRETPADVAIDDDDDDDVAPTSLSVADARLWSGPSVVASIAGRVVNRRRFQDNVTVVALEDDENEDDLDRPRLTCVLHPDVLRDDVGLLRDVLAVGAAATFRGQLLRVAGENDDDEASVLWARRVRLSRSSSDAVAIRRLLDAAVDGTADVEEVADALRVSRDEARELARSSDATERRWRADKSAIELKREETTRRRSTTRVDPKLTEVLDRYRHLARRYPVTYYDDDNDNDVDRLLPVGAPGSFWRGRKRPQIEWVSRRVRTVLESHPAYGERTLTILDVGGGKGALAEHLGRSLGDKVRVRVLEVDPAAVARGRARVRRSGSPVTFSVGDAAKESDDDDTDSESDDPPPDVVVALHACGHLTDVALARAAAHDAGLVIVPCCFLSNPTLTVATTTTTAATSRRRRNRSVEVSDWLGLPADDWTALRTLAERRDDPRLADEAVHVACALRAEAVARETGRRRVSVARFPVEYSARNTVLVGLCGPTDDERPPRLFLSKPRVARNIREVNNEYT